MTRESVTSEASCQTCPCFYMEVQDHFLELFIELHLSFLFNLFGEEWREIKIFFVTFTLETWRPGIRCGRFSHGATGK